MKKYFQSSLLILLIGAGLSACKKGEVINTIGAIILTQPSKNQVFSVSDTITIAGTVKLQDLTSIEASLIDSRTDTIFKNITLVSGDSIPFVYKTTLNTPGIYTADIFAWMRNGSGSGTSLNIWVQ